MLRPQDILVLLKIVSAEAQGLAWHQMDLAAGLNLSQAEISLALKRSAKSALYQQDGKKVKRNALLELLVHGVKYIFPARLGAPTRGLPTAWAAPPMADAMTGGHEAECPVWPYADGDVRGSAVEPLYKTVPRAALSDEALYETVALTDAIRLGRARERDLAEKMLRQKLTK